MSAFVVFSTPKNQYLYDRYSNAIVRITDEESIELSNILDGKILKEESRIYRELQKKGILKEREIEVIEHPETPYLPHLLAHNIEQLTLQVTQNCNLRCSYCVYGGSYINRHHCNKRMDFQMAKKAIDFALERSSDSRRLSIGFYGGEPFLEFELIKQCINYVHEMVEGKDVLFTVTTNGTLLTEDKMKFLSENDVQVVISLDGMKEEHDRNRKFANGLGSFDVIMNNIKKIKELYPTYVKQNVNFNTVISPNTNLSRVEKYFSVNEVLSDSYVMFNSLSESGLEETLEYEEIALIKRRFEYLKMLLFMLGKVAPEYVSRIMTYEKFELENTYRGFQKHIPIPRYMHHSGPCVPGIKRCFVSCDGNLYPCERVPELQCTCIGNISSGFEEEKVSSMLNIGKLSAEECKRCWALRLCMLCIKDIQLTENIPGKKEKISACAGSKSNVLANIMTAATLYELGYQPPEEEA